jgi:hypothetical protein
MASPIDVPIKQRAYESSPMPIEYHINKSEITEIYEDPLQLENYQQDLLKDYRPDPPTLASDAPRRNPDRSIGFLNTIHGGSRSGNIPAHPEIFLGDMTRDPRGFTDEPDFRQMAEQAKRRDYVIKAQMGNDDDPSITGGGVSQAYFSHWRNHTIPYMRERLKNFGYSYGTMIKPLVAGNMRQTSRASEVMLERGKFVPTYELINTPEKGSIFLSNVTNLGMRSTPDHLVNVGMENKIYSIKGDQVIPINRDLLATDMEFQPSMLFKNRKNLAKTM